MNFYDILLAKKLSGGGGGDITTEALNVTANGQYTAPQGKAYTPVNVNVAGYKVGEVQTPTPIATFNGTANPLKSLTASIVPVQSGSGDPSPTNVRPISGWTEEVITVADDTTTPTVEQTYTIPFTDSQGQSVEVFGGSVDVVNGGEQQSTLGKFILDENSTIYTGSSGMPFRISIADIKRSTSESSLLGLLSNQMKEVTQSATWGDECTMSVITNSDRIFFKLTNDITTVEDLKTYLAQHPIEIIYPLATPTTFYTQPTSIKSLDGENNVFASTGDVEELKYFEEL